MIRLDERILSIKADIEKANKELEQIRAIVDKNKEEERQTLKLYVTKEEFLPIQRAFYAIAGLIGMTVFGTLLSLVINKPPV